MAQTARTKSALTAAKRARALAEEGYDLIDKKRNILVRELMTRLDEAKALQASADRTFTVAYAAMRLAEISMGGSAEAGADGVEADNSVQLRFKSVMGVEVPFVTAEDFQLEGPPYGLAFTGADLDEAYFKFAEVKKLIHKLAETENAVYRLAYAIRKAQKRSNALKNVVIPSLDADIARISEELEEKEREEFVRLKVVKRQKLKKSSAALQ